MTEISLSEWKQALVDSQPHDEGQTINEIAEATGIPYETLRTKIKNGVKSGKYTAGKAIRKNKYGRSICFNVYKINKKKGK